MAHGGHHGMVPAGPKMGAEEFRHEMEWPATLATVGITIVILVVFGQLTSMLLALIVPVVMTIFSIWLSNISHKGHMVQVGPTQFPHLHQMAVNIAQRLDMPLPHLYVTQSPVMNAFASGLTLPGNVVFHSALLEAMSEAEIATVMAHEFGHIKCRHVVYMVLQQLFMGTLGNSMFAIPLKTIFFFSSRTKEYSADRAALLGTMDIQACVTSEIKLAVGPKLYEQMNIRAYLQQIADFNSQTSSKFIELLSNTTHPLTINRIQAILRFYRAEKYQKLAHRWGKAGTSTLTSGQVGTADLFHRVASKADWEKQLRAAGGTPAPAPVQAAPAVNPAPAFPIDAFVQATQGAPATPGFAPSPAAPAYTPPVSQAAPAVQAATSTCSTCGLPMAAHARFCPNCGTGVAGSAIPQPAAPAPEAPPAERPVVQVVRRATRATAEGTAAPTPVATPVPQPTTIACTSCGATLAPGAKFCGGCGTPVAAQ
ncbi:MAG TPA: M48 family metalloprotease [Symbiobacteriaceae bacterium]|nr:M48 family metalloprotease [Symbiobacteriaceae bacterium]